MTPYNVILHCKTTAVSLFLLISGVARQPNGMRPKIQQLLIPHRLLLLSLQSDRLHMALPSRLGAFMAGAALGAAQCFYWLHDDVRQLHSAMTAKIDHITSQVSSASHFASISNPGCLTVLLVACSRWKKRIAVPD